MIRSMIPGFSPSPLLPVRTRNRAPGMTIQPLCPSHIDGLQTTLNPSAPAIGSITASVLIPMPKFQLISFPSTPISLGSKTWPWTLNLWRSAIYLKKVQRIVHIGFIIAMAVPPGKIWLFHSGEQVNCISASQLGQFLTPVTYSIKSNPQGLQTCCYLLLQCHFPRDVF